MSKAAPLVVAITGGSGAPYAIRLLDALVRAKRTIWLIVSEHGLRLLSTESDVATVDALRSRVGSKAWDQLVTVFDDGDRGASPASGSARSSGMVVCPCSMGTLSAIAAGSSRSLIERAADVALSAVHIQNMLRVTRAGAVVLPAAPGFYHRPASIDDLVAFVVARVLDQLDVEHDLVRRWSSGARQTET